MKVLSLSNPWLWAIDTLEGPGAKRIENRSWKPPADVIGKRIALHAAHSWDDDGIAYFIRLGIEHPQRRELYAKGKITSVATVERVIDIAHDDVALWDLPDLQRRWAFGPYAWVLVDVRRLPNPIPHRGAQGMRFLPAAIVAQIEEQLQ